MRQLLSWNGLCEQFLYACSNGVVLAVGIEIFGKMFAAQCTDDEITVSTLLEQISSQYGTDFGLMAASVTIIVIPVMIVYVLLQKNIIKGLTAGAVKG